jgi:L-ascorbate metabolism protein UlaG (beta-lactamase superfamily)
VDTLLLPTSGPWTVTAQAIDFVRAVAPRQSIPIHDAMLSDLGRMGADRMLGERGLTGVPMLPLQPGESVEL